MDKVVLTENSQGTLQCQKIAEQMVQRMGHIKHTDVVRKYQIMYHESLKKWHSIYTAIGILNDEFSAPRY